MPEHGRVSERDRRAAVGTLETQPTGLEGGLDRIRRTRITRSSEALLMRDARAGPRNAVTRAPAIIATIAGARMPRAATFILPARETTDVPRVTNEMARLSGTACLAA